MKEDILNALQMKLKNKVKEDVNLFPHLTLRMGTIASYFVEVTTREDLVAAIRAAHKMNIPYLLLGGGSNTVILKKRLDALVIKNNYAYTKVLEDAGTTADLLVSSGYSMGKLVGETVENGWEGLEYHKGLPGSVGGAVYMNSKWTRPLTYVGDLIVSAQLLDASGNEKKVNRDYFHFAYDYSILQQTKEAVIDVVLRLKKTARETLRKRAEESLEYRKKTQPFGVATAGCFFRNISKEVQTGKGLPTSSAGYLIDQAGLKGAARGGFEVSKTHANFIINSARQGSPDDLLELVKEIKEKVRQKFGIDLEEEVVAL